MITKYGVVTTDSHSDFDLTKKAKYLDELGTGIADEAHKHLLKSPVEIKVYEELTPDTDEL